MRFLLTLLAVLMGASAQAQTPVERIAILGCHRQTEPALALDRYADLDPDLALWVGDNVYVDTQDDPQAFHDAYAALAARPGFQRLRERAVTLATWDDHDYGDNNEDRLYALKDTSRQIFRAFWDLADAIPDDRPGVYHARRFPSPEGTLQVILLDVRTHRDPPGSDDADLLGATQWAWLEAQLRQPADLRLIVSGTQLLVPAASGSETWDAYPQARARLFGLVRRTQAERVVFVTGDQHYAEVGRLRGALDVDAVEVQFASVNQIEAPEFNPHRVAPAATSLHSLAWIDVQWRATDEDPPHLVYRVADAETGQVELTYRVNFSELDLAITAASDMRFWPTGTAALTHAHPGLALRYTLDGTAPTAASPRYTAPLVLDATTVVTAALFDPAGFARTRPHAFRFERMDPLPPVEVADAQPGLRYTYVEGAFERLPDFAALTPAAEGITRTLRPDSLARRADHYALLFEGFVEVPETGLYTVVARSDDGSRVYLHDRLVVDNDGSHSARTRTGQIALEAGRHPLRIAYFEDYAGQTLEVGLRLGDGPLLPLAPNRVVH